MPLGQPVYSLDSQLCAQLCSLCVQCSFGLSSQRLVGRILNVLLLTALVAGLYRLELLPVLFELLIKYCYSICNALFVISCQTATQRSSAIDFSEYQYKNYFVWKVLNRGNHTVKTVQHGPRTKSWNQWVCIVLHIINVYHIVFISLQLAYYIHLYGTRQNCKIFIKFQYNKIFFNSESDLFGLLL